MTTPATPPPPAPVPPEIVAQRQDMMDEDIEIVRHWVRETHSVTHIDANAISEAMARRIIIAAQEGSGEAVDAFARIARRLSRAPLPAELAKWKFCPSHDSPLTNSAVPDCWINEETGEVAWEKPLAESGAGEATAGQEDDEITNPENWQRLKSHRIGEVACPECHGTGLINTHPGIDEPCPECATVYHNVFSPPEPTSSESSGDVHLARALEEVERLKRDLITVREQRNSVRIQRDEANAALAAAHAKALHQEADRQYHMNAINVLAKAVGALGETSETVVKVAIRERDAALANLQRLVHLYEKQYDDAGEHRPDWLTNALLATPSPAPVAGKTNPTEISSPLVGAGEKDSAGPTPRTDKEIDDHHEIALHLVRASFARTLERELTASETLRREAEESVRKWTEEAAELFRQRGVAFEGLAELIRRIESAGYSQAGTSRIARAQIYESDLTHLKALTPPVAGGEG